MVEAERIVHGNILAENDVQYHEEGMLSREKKIDTNGI
jgi:hypothetical protein